MTQSQLAAQIGLNDFMTVSRWERGQHRPSNENLVALSEALNITVGELFTELAA